jgi:hypothetical protein
MNDQQSPPDMPPPPMASPIAGPSKLVRLTRWWGLGLFALGLVVAVISGQVSEDPAVRAVGPVLGLVGTALYLGGTIIRAFQWRRD